MGFIFCERKAEKYGNRTIWKNDIKAHKATVYTIISSKIFLISKELEIYFSKRTICDYIFRFVRHFSAKSFPRNKFQYRILLQHLFP